jgi:hypothetical protein
MKKRLKIAIPLIAILVLPLLLFHKAVTGSSVIVSGDFSGSDLLDLNYPFKAILEKAISHGHLPLWEPNLSLGFPVLAEGQIGAFYPINILLTLLPAHLALNYSVIASFMLAGFWMFIYARSLKRTNFSAFITAITFMFSAFFVVRAKHVNMIASAAWVPFLFWATRKLFQERKLRYATLIGIGLALQFLAGHPEMTFFSLFLFLVYLVFEAFLAVRKDGVDTILPLAVLSLCTASVVAAGLSAVQILPSLEFTRLTEREEFTVQTATAYPFHPKNLITFISPYYFGNPATGSYREDIRTTGIFWENASYFGLLPLVLAIWAVVSTIRKKPRNPYMLFFMLFALLALLLTLGRYTPIYGWLWQLLPGFQLFRFPNRFNLYVIFSLTLLAGVGADLLVTKLMKYRFASITAKGPEGFKFTWPLKAIPTQTLIAGFILVDLFVFASSYNGTLSTQDFLKTPQSVERIRQDESVFRMYSLTQYGPSPYAALGWKKDPRALLAIRQAIPPNNNVMFDLAAFNDRSWFEGGLGVKRRGKLENWLLNENQNAVLVGKVLGTFNVKYILGFAEEIGIEIEKIEEYNLGEDFAVPLNLFENKQVIPRAVFVPEAEVVQDEDAAFDRLISLEFLPTKTVILEKEPQEIPPQFTGALDMFREENPVTIAKYEDNEVTIEADIKDHGFLVLSDLFYPGWKAQIDGSDAEILQANYLVRAIELTPGTHTIRFFYDPLSFKIGAIVSGSTIGIILLIIIVRIGIKFLKRKPTSSLHVSSVTRQK